jgi:two-component system, response regulator
MKARFILLVEDNPDDEALTLRALRKNNITNEVIVVRDGVEVLDFLSCRGTYASRDPEEMPELILLDLRLPKVDGVEVLRQLRADQRTQWLPIVILTSSNADRDMVDSLHYGANAYMRKPVDFSQFVAAVRELGLYLVVLKEDVLNYE